MSIGWMAPRSCEARWLADGHSLSTIRATSVLPVDLNSLMVHLEQTLAKEYRIKGDGDRSSHFIALAVCREAAIRRLMWNERSHAFTDHAWQRHEAVPVTAAGLFPLFLHVANQHQADRVPKAADAWRHRDDTGGEWPTMGSPQSLGPAAVDRSRRA